MTDGVQQIEDPADLVRVRRQARRVLINAFLAAILLVLIALALPKGTP